MDREALRTSLQLAADQTTNVRLIIDGHDLDILPVTVSDDPHGNLKVTTTSPAIRNARTGFTTDRLTRPVHQPAPVIDGFWLIDPARVSAVWVFDRPSIPPSTP